MEVEEIIDKWYGAEYTYFKLIADDGNIYILKYDEHNDEWKLEFFKNKKLREV